MASAKEWLGNCVFYNDRQGCRVRMGYEGVRGKQGDRRCDPTDPGRGDSRWTLEGAGAVVNSFPRALV